MLLWKWIALIALWGSLGASLATKIHLGVESGWEQTSILMEASEFVSDFHSPLFFPFVENVRTRLNDSAKPTDEELLEGLLAACGEVIGDFSVAAMSLALSVRSYSPRVEMHRSIAADYWDTRRNLPQSGACAWIDYGDDHPSFSVRVPDVFDSAAVTTFDLDHIYNPLADALAVPTVIFYADLRDNSFDSLHVELKAAADKGLIRYVFRHADCGKVDGEPVMLQGYGVELMVKNMEYKAVDDTEVREDDEAAVTTGDAAGEDEEDIGGFYFNRLFKRRPELREKLEEFRGDLQDEAMTLAQQDSDGIAKEGLGLRPWELRDLGVQATQRIMSAARPLDTLREVSQSFIALAQSLSRLKVQKRLRSEAKYNINRLDLAGFPHTLVLLNGLPLESELYAAVEQTLREVSLVQHLQEEGIPQPILHDVLLATHSEDAEAETYDLRPRKRAAGAVQFLNDLEADPAYQRWPWGLSAMLQPLWPGHLHQLRRNVFTVVAVVDPRSRAGLNLIAHLSYLSSRMFPSRFGFVLLPPQDYSKVEKKGDGNPLTHWGMEAASLSFPEPHDKDDIVLAKQGPEVSVYALKLYTYLRDKSRSGDGGVRLLINLNAALDASADQSPSLSLSMLRKVFVSTFKELRLATDKEGGAADVFEMVILGTKRNKFVDQSRKYASQLGFDAYVSSWENQYSDEEGTLDGFLGAPPLLFVNGRPVSTENVRQTLQPSIYRMEREIQELVHSGKLTDAVEPYDYMLEREGVLRAYTPAASQDFTRVDMTQRPAVAYLNHNDSSSHPVTLWVAANPTSLGGLSALQASLLYSQVQHAETPRVGVAACLPHMFSESVDADVSHALLGRLGSELLQLYKAQESSTVAASEYADALRRIERLVAELVVLEHEGHIESNTDVTDVNLDDLLEYHRLTTDVCSYVSPAGGSALIANGRLVQQSGVVTRSVLETIVSLELPVGLKVQETLSRHLKSSSAVVSPHVLSDMVMKSTSLILREENKKIGSSQWTRRSSKSGRLSLPNLRGNHTLISVPGSHSLIRLEAVVDPLDGDVRKVVPIAMAISEALNAPMKMYLVPTLEVQEVPLKTLFKYVVSGSMRFDSSGNYVPPMAEFSNIPRSLDPLTLTLSVDVPDAWVISQTYAPYDLDNLILGAVTSERGVVAKYELEHILIQGSCVDSVRYETPSGLELVMGTRGHPHIEDTLVMSNYGYFQLKANPGVWELGIASGRASDVYEITAVSSTPPKRSSLTGSLVKDATSAVVPRVVVDDFRGKMSFLSVARLPGMDDVELLENSEESTVAGRLWNTMSSMWKENDLPPTNETVHVFTIASGHLYERFMRIMMLSAVENTDNPVKFWILKNFVSPKFKLAVAHMADEYGFEFEFVTYKWPAWLRRQTEKQRTMWGYKILFLDVLFPLSVEKIVFVDADQIVRGNLAELLTIDLEGAPYAYTPFCSDRVEMDGYRFWKQGFWESHLRGKPYHISALYLVDLKRFRSMRAGDELRILYEQLSRDPNSLANLDQDLPNYAQHQVPIYSLPQHWLWCESWCSDESKAQAKTIDLCNNPMTKEPKLDGARRIVPEWVRLDNQVRASEERFLNSSTTTTFPAVTNAGTAASASAFDPLNGQPAGARSESADIDDSSDSAGADVDLEEAGDLSRADVEESESNLSQKEEL